MRRTSLLIFIGVATLLLSRGAAATGDCGPHLGQSSDQRWTENDLHRAIIAQPYTLTPSEMSTFLNQGLPQLITLAQENGITILDVLENVRAGAELIAETFKAINMKGTADQVLLGLRNLRGIETLTGKTKFKRAHFERVNPVVYMFATVINELAKSEARRTGSCRQRRIHLIDQNEILNLLAAADDSLLDHALAKIDRFRQGWQSHQQHARDTRAARSAATRFPRVDPPTVETPPAVPHEATPEIVSPVSPAPPEDAPSTNALGVILKTEGPLVAERPYFATTTTGLELNVTLSPYLMKQHDGGDQPVIRRLLKSIMVGRTHAGLKVMSEVGPRIVEAKTVMHGHKRIIGCLDGRSVRLLYLVDIKASVATYAKRIPRNLCE